MEADGDQLVTRAEFYNNQTKETWEYEAGADGNFGIFVFAGYVPNTEWIGPEVEKNEQGYLLTDSNQKTNLDGVYAAGDVCVKQLRQVGNSSLRWRFCGDRTGKSRGRTAYKAESSGSGAGKNC